MTRIDFRAICLEWPTNIRYDDYNYLIRVHAHTVLKIIYSKTFFSSFMVPDLFHYLSSSQNKPLRYFFCTKMKEKRHISLFWFLWKDEHIPTRVSKIKHKCHRLWHSSYLNRLILDKKWEFNFLICYCNPFLQKKLEEFLPQKEGKKTAFLFHMFIIDEKVLLYVKFDIASFH